MASGAGTPAQSLVKLASSFQRCICMRSMAVSARSEPFSWRHVADLDAALLKIAVRSRRRLDLPGRPRVCRWVSTHPLDVACALQEWDKMSSWCAVLLAGAVAGKQNHS